MHRHTKTHTDTKRQPDRQKHSQTKTDTHKHITGKTLKKTGNKAVIIHNIIWVEKTNEMKDMWEGVTGAQRWRPIRGLQTADIQIRAH